MQVVELCHGCGCTLAPYCHRYRHVEPAPGIAIKFRLPTQPGEGCPDYQARTRPKWGDGPDGSGAI